jgi:DNA repair exonuclease SbcCD ATPase subunit
VPLFNRRDDHPVTMRGEQERLHAVRVAAEQELTRLRTELAERVAAVERRERELADALTKARRGGGGAPANLPAGAESALSHAQVGLAAHAQELTKKEAELAARERAIVKLETDLARRAAGEVVDPEERLAQIEARLKALQEAEKSFARTQAELATKSDELTRREAELQDQLQAIGQGASMASTPGLSRAELADLEDRLERLERETRDDSIERSFGDGIRRLERRGLHPSE